jgi:glucan biosynthesis protein C
MKTRLNYLDHLRVFLVTFVILHHVAVIYGAAAPFYYLEPPYSDFRAFQALLLFNLGYLAWRILIQKRFRKLSHKSSRLAIRAFAIFILVLAGASYFWRMVIPMGRPWLGFPSLAYLPQYLSFFIVGIIAFRRDWLQTLGNRQGVVGFIFAILAGVILFPLAFSGQMFSLTVGPLLQNAMGNGYWQSAVYALWDSAFAVGICLTLIVLFRRFFNGKGRLGSFLSQSSYSVYFVHTPIVVYLAYVLRGLDLPNLTKFGLVSAISVPICFAVAFMIKKIPGVSRVL